MSKFIWLNGELLEYEKANIHVMNAALHYGAAVFEGLRAYRAGSGSSIFRLREHAARLIASAEVMGFHTLPFSVEDVMQAIRDTLRANQLSECYIRPLLYLDGPVWSLNIDAGKASLMIAVWEWESYLGEEAARNGVRANVSSFTRHHPNASMTKAKISGNYVNSILAKTESIRLGFEEAIMLDPEGYVAECTGENLFIVRGGRIFTPTTESALEGITRSTIVALAQDLGLDMEERRLSRDQLYIADEVFVCGTAAEVVGIREIDFRRIGGGEMGPVTRRLQELYGDVVRARLPKYESWCEIVEGVDAAH